MEKEHEYWEIIDSSVEGSYVRDVVKNEMYVSKKWEKGLGIETLSPKEQCP